MSAEQDGVLRLESRGAAARALIGLARSLPRSAVELVAEERQLQAAAEDADARRLVQGVADPPTLGE